MGVGVPLEWSSHLEPLRCMRVANMLYLDDWLGGQGVMARIPTRLK